MSSSPPADDLLTPYLADVGRHPLLTPRAEQRLARAAAAGDPDARRRLAECNLRLVVTIARRHQGLGLDLPDLIQEGNLGLLDAVDRFDWRRGVRFSTYASWWIRRAIRLALSTKSRTIRMPRRLAESSARRAGAELAYVSLSEPVSEDGDALEELLPDADTPDPADLVANDDAGRFVRATLENLQRPARRVLELRYGLDGGQARTQAEVAGELGVSRPRIQYLESRALNALAQRPDLRSLRAAA